jgi:hypothetical protein
MWTKWPFLYGTRHTGDVVGDGDGDGDAHPVTSK